MKKLLLIALVVVLGTRADAQFSHAKLQATGLTCAMCSNAINKALQKLPFVDSVRSDIKNSSFAIGFKNGTAVSIDALKDAVEDAGFSIGDLKLEVNFPSTTVQKDQHLLVGNTVFHVLNGTGQQLSGEHTVTVVDKHYLSDKQFRKFSQSSKMECVETGRAGSCCAHEGITANQRIYHIVI